MTGTRPKLIDWTSDKVRGRIYEVWTSPQGDVVLLGAPEPDDESHNCDANGCGQDHVLWRHAAAKGDK